jgi:hypothetical protein
MQTNPASVMVDLRQALSWQRIGELEGELGAMDGVTRAQVSSRASRLLLVDYDPKTINSQKILGAIVRRGFDARLIGM